MACGACSKRRDEKDKKKFDVMGGYKYLPERQLKARLETFKKHFCSNCDNRYTCDFEMYSNCTKK